MKNKYTAEQLAVKWGMSRQGAEQKAKREKVKYTVEKVEKHVVQTHNVKVYEIEE